MDLELEAAIAEALALDPPHWPEVDDPLWRNAQAVGAVRRLRPELTASHALGLVHLHLAQQSQRDRAH